MATFANQSSNLSALSSALTSFSELLDVSDDAVSRLTKAENQENAQLFWTTQRRRVDAIDESLLEATEDILPVSHDAKTITEMAELCRIVQEATRQKMGLLRTRLELLGVTTSWNDSITSPPKVGGSSDQRGGSGSSISRKNNNNNNNNKQTMIQWSVSVGGPLDCVIEGDVETEGATTPGSLLHPSPLFGGSSSTSKRKTSLTPTTPTMKTFSFSSSTASILEKMSLPMGTPSSSSKRGNRTPRSIKASPSPSSSGTRRRSERHLNFDGFQEEDDMISLNTTMEAAAAAHSHAAGTAAAASTSDNHPSSNTASPSTSTTITSQNIVPATAPSPVVKLKEERSQFLARMESMLERVEEELVHETRPSDETSTRKSSSSASRQPKIMMERPSNSKFLEEIPHEEEEGENDNDDDDDDSDSVDDDSTNMIATLVAEKPEPMGKDIKRPVPVFFHRPTHIMVDTAGVPSPTHTNITMDATMMMMNDTMISSASVVMHDDDGDNDSTVTPILDRYRLDPDDNSIGVRVVPNQRGQHHQHHHDRQHDYFPREEPSHRATATADAYSKTEFYTDPEGFMSPKGLPGSVSARKTKQYRKTPFPKKQLEQSFDEENHPNMRTTLTFSPAAASSTRSTSSLSFDASNPESSFSVPPLRPRSLGQSSRRRSTTSRSASLPLRTQSLPAKVAALPKTPEVVVPRAAAAAAANDSTREWMEKITMAEYNMAPRVVQMQVTREQANQSIDVLQNMFSAKYQSQQPLEFSAPEGYQALQHILDTELRSKSVLMSLCHWKRLLMYRDSVNGMIFAVNTFE